MNLILVDQQDFIDSYHVRLTDRRFEHIRSIHKAVAGDILNMGVVNGKIGTATVVGIDDHQVLLHTELVSPPPSPLPVILVLALPRPIMLKRILQTCAAMGVKKIILINSSRVEKSYWQTPLLKSPAINEQLILGLEQAKDTLLPEVIFEKHFKPFVEDKLLSISRDTHKLVAHPGSRLACPKNGTEPTTLVIGPEGGFIPYEVEKLQAIGFTPIHLGQRILRVETAIPSLLTQLFF